MRIAHVVVIGLVALLTVAGICRADLEADLERESVRLRPIMPEAEKLTYAGFPDQGEAKILAAYPEKTRTPAQNLLLANILFRSDHAMSYKLHKAAADALPDDPAIAYEWAIEMQRAGEWDKAAVEYQKAIKAAPGNGVMHGLLAECLLRSGKTRDAAEEWLKSEQGHGSLEDFESLDCEIHSSQMPDTDRASLTAKVRTGDIDAAEALVIFDCNFFQDWWNNGPEAHRLAVDRELFGKSILNNAGRLKEIDAAAQCGLALSSSTELPDAAVVTPILANAGLLVDEKHTLPASSGLFMPMLDAAVYSHAMTGDAVLSQLGPAVLAKAKSTKDAGWYMAALQIYNKTDQAAGIAQSAWDDTGDVRFARTILFAREQAGKLTATDAVFTAAIDRFPHDGVIAGMHLLMTRHDDPAYQDRIVAAIEAECDHLTGGAMGDLRPSALSLRIYYKSLSDLLKVSVKNVGEPQMTVRESVVSNGQLKLVVETSRRYQSAFRTASQTADARGWLLTVDLSKPESAADRIKVTGPLWDVPSPRSELSFQSGANWTKEDADAAAATPGILLAGDGVLHEFIRAGTPSKLMERHLDEAKSVWVDDCDATAIANAPRPAKSEDIAQSPDGHYEVRCIKGTSTVYDVFAGKTVDDPWLADAFTQARKIEHFEIVGESILGDRSYLFCSPSEMVNYGPADGGIVTTFSVNGKTYDRKTHGLVWRRGQKDPLVFDKKPPFNGPSAGVSIGGKLYLYYPGGDEMELVPLEGGDSFKIAKAEGVQWFPLMASRPMPDDANHRVCFLDTIPLMAKPGTYPVSVYAWDYKASKVTTITVQIDTLFKKSDEGNYIPTAATAVK